MTATDFEMLNAYVDGELSADAAVLVETRIASDAALAQQVAVLGRMKRQVAAMGSEYVVFQAPRRNGGGRAAAIAAAAAVLCLVFLGGWLGALAFEGRTKAAPGGETAQALALHDDWSARLVETGAPAVDIRSFEVPALGAAGLSLVSLRSDAMLDGRLAVQAGYLGRHGCRLSLFRLEDSGKAQSLDIVTDGNASSATWADGSFRYALVARRLDRARFAVVADALQAMTSRPGSSAPQEVVAQLEGAHQPCNG